MARAAATILAVAGTFIAMIVGLGLALFLSICLLNSHFGIVPGLAGDGAAGESASGLVFAALVFGIPLLFGKLAWRSLAPGPATTACRRCGYDLRGSAGPACPECGEATPMPKALSEP